LQQRCAVVCRILQVGAAMAAERGTNLLADRPEKGRGVHCGIRHDGNIFKASGIHALADHADLKMLPSWRIPQSTPRPFSGRSVRRLVPRSKAIAAPTSKIRQTTANPCWK